MKIIGITGTLGAGKGTIVDYLTTHHGFKHFSVRGYLLKIINQKGMEVNRDSMVDIANELRATNSPSFIAEELFKEAMESGQNCIIESIRKLGEVQALKARASETDRISFDTFVENEEREMNSTDPNKQNIAACMQLADYTFTNDGSLEELYKEIDVVLGNSPIK